MRTNRQVRRAALTVEVAIVLPVMLIFLLGLIVGGMGVFRYQQVACQAREAARWASVRGKQWEVATGRTSPTEQEILNNAVLPMAIGMEKAKITIQVEWINEASGVVVAWDSSTKSPRSLTKSSQTVTNSVRVRISYEWRPGVVVPGAIHLTSTSVMPMSF